MSKRRIYIYHGMSDVDWVRALAESLRSQDVEVWLDELQVRSGERSPAALEKGFRGSDVVVFVIAPDNVRRPSLFFDLGAVIAAGKRAVSIVSNDVPAADVPYPLRVRRGVPRKSPEETAKKLLAETAA
jgi:hypothetical protein